MTGVIAMALAFTVASTTFKHNGTLPERTVYNASGCSGENRSPELHWSGAPADTRSYAILMHDPDAPAAGGFDHWLAYNVPASRHELPEAARLRPDQLGVTGFGKQHYTGPCPPPGKPHHYVITLYAVDMPNIGHGGMHGRDMARALQGHVLKTATITGLYESP